MKEMYIQFCSHSESRLARMISVLWSHMNRCLFYNYYFFMGCKSGARGSRRNMQTLPAPDRLPDKERRMLNQFNTSSQQHAKNNINSWKILSLKTIAHRYGRDEPRSYSDGHRAPKPLTNPVQESGSSLTPRLSDRTSARKPRRFRA